MSDFPPAPDPMSTSRHWWKDFGYALDPSVLRTTFLAFLIGITGGLVSEAVLKLIYLFTNIFFAGHWSFSEVYPELLHLGPWVIIIPAIGGVVAGLVIHFWEPTLKGHGIPETMEAVLIAKSRVRARVGILKPLTSALAIGTGGPFGAEGPIIQTGAAIGSVFAGILHLTPYQRRILLAAGAAAGLSATFLSPLTGIVLCIELLLFEFSARSFIPVAIASATATAVAVFFRGWSPLFAMPAYHLESLRELWLFAIMGVLIAIISILLIRSMFWLEDRFDHFPIRPGVIWAPTLGGLLTGVIGWLCPQIFGTSYDTITKMLNNHLGAGKLLGISAAKFGALVISLASGTTGGVFAPTLVIGGGFGSAFAAACHHIFSCHLSDPGLYSLVAMGALFGSLARAPLTAIVFMIELGRDPYSITPIIVCVIVADCLVRLLNADSIMTGKLHKHGVIVAQEYSAPILLGTRVRDVMHRHFGVVSGSTPVASISGELFETGVGLVVAVDNGNTPLGFIEKDDLLHAQGSKSLKVSDIARRSFILAHPTDQLSDITSRMLDKQVRIAVVLVDENMTRPVGILDARDVLQLRRYMLQRHLFTPPSPVE